MDNLAEKESITIGPPARCARHDNTLPGHIKTIVITLGNMFQPSSLTKIQIRLVSWYLRLRMSEKKRCNTNRHCKILGKWLWKWVRRRGFIIIKPRRGWGGGWWAQRQFIENSKRMDFHNYVNKEIPFSRSKVIMMHARGKPTQVNIGWKMHP